MTKRRMEARNAIEVAVTGDGFLTITEDDPQDTEPRVIYLEPAQIPTVIEWLNELPPEAEKARHAHLQSRRRGSPT